MLQGGIFQKSSCSEAELFPSEKAAFFSTRKGFLTTDLTLSYNKCTSTVGLCSTCSHYQRLAAEERQVFDPG